MRGRIVVMEGTVPFGEVGCQRLRDVEQWKGGCVSLLHVAYRPILRHLGRELYRENEG